MAPTPSPGAQLPPDSPDRHRTFVQHTRAAAGLNPLTAQRAHPDAPPDPSPYDRFPRYGTCGTCAFMVRMQDGKKMKTRVRAGEKIQVPVMVMRCGFGDGERITGGPASELRSWWPGCLQYEPAPDAPPRPDPVRRRRAARS